MKRILGFSLFVALTLAGKAGFAADECTTLTLTGHPQYPVIAYKDGDTIAGVAPAMVQAIGKEINVPVESKYTGSWEDAQAAARDGKVDIIVGIYQTPERAQYLDYVQPAFIYDEVVIFAAKGKEFKFAGPDDLIGKKGVTNQGESWGTDFDAFIKDKLTVERTNGIDAAFNDLISGKADYLIASYYAGLAEAAKEGVKDQVVPLSPAIAEVEMFVAFSKKSPCKSLAPKFGEGITAMTTDGRFDKLLNDAMAAWDAAQKH